MLNLFVGGVRPFQFEVLRARLISEYQVVTRLETPTWSLVQWFEEKEPDNSRGELGPPKVKLPSGCSVAREQDGQWAVLLPVKYLISILHDSNEDLTFRDSPYD